MKVLSVAAFIAVVVIGLVAVPGSTPGQESDEAVRSLTRAVEALKESQARIQKDLEEIKALLRGRPSAGPLESPSVTFKLTDEPAKGNRDAKLVLIEFTDYQCPFCARHARETMPALDAEYIASGKLRYVVMDFPLESIHPAAPKAAEAGHCAGEQGKYWEMHDRLFENQRNLAHVDLGANAQELALDPVTFKRMSRQWPLSGARPEQPRRRTAGRGEQRRRPSSWGSWKRTVRRSRQYRPSAGPSPFLRSGPPSTRHCLASECRRGSARIAN